MPQFEAASANVPERDHEDETKAKLVKLGGVKPVSTSRGVIPLPVEWHGPGRMEGEDKAKGLERLNWLDVEIERVKEEIELMQEGLEAREEYVNEVEEYNRSLEEEPRVQKVLNVLGNTRKGLGLSNGSQVKKRVIEQELDREIIKDLRAEIIKAREDLEGMIAERGRLEESIYTPELKAEFEEIHRRLQESQEISTEESKVEKKQEDKSEGSIERVGEFELCWHPKQKQEGGWIEGTELEAYLRENGLYERTLSLEDNVVKGWIEHPETYPEEFKDKAVFLWKSQQGSDSDRRVAQLYWAGSRVLIHWRWLGDRWRGRSPVLLKSSSEPKSDKLVEADASAEAGEGLSLNEFFQTGENLSVAGSFQDLVLSGVEGGKAVKTKHFNLTGSSTDKKIEEKIGPNHIWDESELCATLRELIEIQLGGNIGKLIVGNRFNLFYTNSCVVNVGWGDHDRKWHVSTGPRNANDWVADDRVFSPIT